MERTPRLQSGYIRCGLPPPPPTVWHRLEEARSAVECTCNMHDVDSTRKTINISLACETDAQEDSSNVNRSKQHTVLVASQGQLPAPVDT